MICVIRMFFYSIFISSKFNYLPLECGNLYWNVEKIIFNEKNS